ncbi:MAG: amidohydrolase [Alphaproteobacteria bacterium]
MADTADLIIKNARCLTQDDARPRAEALAIRGRHILGVGSEDEVEALTGAGTRVIDAGGGTVLPGIIESHLHLFGGAAGLDSLLLGEVKGLPALTDAARRQAAARPDDQLIVGFQADYLMLGQEPITRQQLDQALPDRPFAMMAADAHTVWANTRALELAGLLHGRDLPAGHRVVMGEDGLATGELRENEAFGPVLAFTADGGRSLLGYTTGRDPDPRPSAAERAGDRDILKKGLAYCASLGITSIHNMDGNWYQLELLDEIERGDGLRCRVQVPYHHKSTKSLGEIASEGLAMHRRFDSDRLYSGRLKLFMDGVVEASTAFLLEDYASQPGHRGEALFSADEFAAIATEADRLGLQISVHAIGDAAVRRTLDGYAAAREANGARESRHRIEHIEIYDPADLPRFKELGVVASMQPPHAAGGVCFGEQPTMSLTGPGRWPRAFAWRTIRHTGIPLAFSSDWPVAPLDPMLGIQAAVTRKPLRDGLPEQAQTLDEALTSYTRIGAFAEFAEDKKGILKPGLFADVVVMDRDLEATDPEALSKAKPIFTICDGRVTYEA